MRGLWAVLVVLGVLSALWSAPDLDVLEPLPQTGTGPVEVSPLPIGDATKTPASQQPNGFLGVSIPSHKEVSPSSLEVLEDAPSAEGQIGSVGEEDLTKSELSYSERDSARSEESGGDLSPSSKQESDPEEQLLGFEDSSPERQPYEPMGELAFLGVLATLFGVLFLWVWYRKQLRGKIQPNARLPMQVLGQTWLDGQSKILTLRVGSKILIVAKSSQYCTTLDVITDPDEVNLITLGGGQGEEDFQKILKETKPNPKDIPDAEGIQADLKELKRQLGTLKGPS